MGLTCANPHAFLRFFLRCATLWALALAVAHRAEIGAAEQSPAPVTGILGAFSDEVAMLEQSLSGAQSQTIRGIRFVTGSLKGRRVVIASSGVGKVNAAMSATLLIDHFKPSEVLFTGIAGSVNPELHPGDIVIGAKTAQHDLGTLTPAGMQRRGARSPVDGQRGPVFLEADSRLVSLAESAAGRIELDKIQTSEGLRVPKAIKGVIVTGDVFVAAPAKARELREELKADAVDMESAAVAQVCHVLHVPWLVIRSMSDSADTNAARDAGMFYSIAAENSLRLVTELVALLSSPKI